MFYKYQHSNLAYYYGKPASTGKIKLTCEDFFVRETLAFEPSGEGEHEWLFIEKINLNTHELIELISKASKTPIKNIGYSGLKDKQAVTQQWLSLYRPGLANIEWAQVSLPNVKILKVVRHSKKLKVGTHKQNYFEISIDLNLADITDIKNKINQIKAFGFVNYFGEQRFGNQGKNGTNARKWLSKKNKISRAKKSLYISTLRSEFFNECLSLRVLKKMWLTPVKNDHFILQNTNSFFKYDKNEAELYAQRLKSKDISISQSLLGEQVNEKPNVYEQEVLTDAFTGALLSLKTLRVKAQQRSIRAEAINLTYAINDQENKLLLKFYLSKGQYATSLIREIIDIAQ